MSDFKPQTVKAKAFDVQAAQVTKDNIRDVAQWVNGFVMGDVSDSSFIDFLGGDDKYHRANVGDWIILLDADEKIFKELTVDTFNVLFEAG